MQPAVFANVLGVSSAFLLADHVIVFPECKMRDFPRFRIDVRRPAENRFGKRICFDGIFSHDEGDEESFFIDDHCAAAAKAFDDWDFVSLHFFYIKQRFGLSGDPHDDGARRSFIDDAERTVICAEQRFFELELLENRRIFQMNEMKDIMRNS